MKETKNILTNQATVVSMCSI